MSKEQAPLDPAPLLAQPKLMAASSFRSLERYQKTLRELVGPINIDQHGSGEPSFRMERRACPSSTLFISRFRNIVVKRRNGALGERWEGDVFINLQVRGDLHAAEDGQNFLANSGDVTLVDPMTSNEFWSDKESCFLSLAIPRHELNDAGLPVSLPAGLLINGNIGKGKLLSIMTHAFLSSLESLDENAGALGRASILNLFRESLEEQCKIGLSQDEVVLERMRNWVRAHIHKKKVGVIDLARAFGMSERSFYRFFARNAITPDAWIQTQRIELARDMLQVDGAKVNLIADLVGFNDPSHFSRQFRRLYGETPTSFRARVQKGRSGKDGQIL